MRITGWCWVALVWGLALPAGAQTQERVSDARQRKGVDVRVYADDLALIRERREITLGTGRVRLALRDVASSVRPETVRVRSEAGPEALTLLAQRHRFDLISPDALLRRYVGRGVNVYRWNEKLGREEVWEAKVVSVADRPVLEIDGELTFDFPGRIGFPDPPQDLVAEPTLEWLLESQAKRQLLEISYLTGGMGWQADYALVLDAESTGGSLDGWASVHNRTDLELRDAGVSLVAGVVRRASAQPSAFARGRMALAAEADVAAPEAVGEVYVYRLERPVRLRSMESVQVRLLAAPEVPVTRRLVSRAQPAWFRGLRPEPPRSPVEVRYELTNGGADGLGRPLPAGVVRVYVPDEDGQPVFAGEDRIDHTPRDEVVRVASGEAFDVVVERVQTEFRAEGRCRSESSWRVDVRNRKQSPATVELHEHAAGDWEVVDASLPAERIDASSFRFAVSVEAGGSTRVEYRVRVRWC